MTSSEKILCELVFREVSNQGLETIAGKIDMSQLFSPDNNWIAIENKILERGKLKIVKKNFNKTDVDRIIFYKAQVFLTVNKGDYSLNEILNNKQGAAAF